MPARCSVQEALVGDVMYGQQLDRRDAELRQVRNRRFRRDATERPAEVVADERVSHRESLDVRLVDHRLVPGDTGAKQLVVLPVERLVDDDGLGDGGRVVPVVAGEVGVVAVRRVRKRCVGAGSDRAFDCLRIRIDQELRRVEAVTACRRPRTVDAVAVALPGADPRHVGVPVERGALGELQPHLAVVVVEQAELHPLRVLGEEREVDALPVPERAQREGPARPELAHYLHSSAVRASKSSMSATSPRRIVTTLPSARTSSSRGSLRRSRRSST
jgi:hypothetical protein